MGFIDRSTHHVIRLSLRGCANRPFYLITVQKNRSPRDRKIIEQIGTFDPLPNFHDERLVAINFDRLKHWLVAGAKPSLPMLQLLGLAGYFPIHPKTRLMAFRKQRKIDEQKNQDSETKTDDNENTDSVANS